MRNHQYISLIWQGNDLNLVPVGFQNNVGAHCVNNNAVIHKKSINFLPNSVWVQSSWGRRCSELSRGLFRVGFHSNTPHICIKSQTVGIGHAGKHWHHHRPANCSHFPMTIFSHSYVFFLLPDLAFFYNEQHSWFMDLFRIHCPLHAS